MDLTSVFRNAFTVTRRRPALWLLGALAVLAGQGGGPISWLGVEPRAIRPLQDALVAFLGRITPETLASWAGGLLVLGIVQSALGALLQGGMIAAVAGRQEDNVSPGAALRAAVARFRPLFLVRLLIGVSVLAPALLVMAALILIVVVAASGADLANEVRVGLALMGLCLVPLFVLIALSALVLGWVETLALRSCQLEQLGAVDSMRRGWRLLRSQTRAVLALWVTTLGLGLAGGFVIGTAASALSAAAVTALVVGEPPAPMPLAGLALAYALVLAAGGALTAMQSAVWTIGYQDMTVNREAPPRVTQ